MSRIAAIWAALTLGRGAVLWSQEGETSAHTTPSGGLDAQAAIFVIVILIIALVGLVLYEVVVRRRAR